MFQACFHRQKPRAEADSPEGNDRKRYKGRNKDKGAECGGFPPIPQKRGMDGAPGRMDGARGIAYRDAGSLRS